MNSRSVGVLLFDEVDVLDFAGPFEVFSVAGREHSVKPFNVFTVAEHARPVLARERLSINPAHTFSSCPRIDLLLVPGGWGTRPQLKNPVLLDWLRHVGREAELVMSVCTGSMLLGAAGLLDGLSATTHHERYGLLREVAPKARVVTDRRVVDAGRVVTCGGVSSGINMAFHVVTRLLGVKEAAGTADYIEYPYRFQSEA